MFMFDRKINKKVIIKNKELLLNMFGIKQFIFFKNQVINKIKFKSFEISVFIVLDNDVYSIYFMGNQRFGRNIVFGN